MIDQFYEPAPGDLVACDDGLHFILLDEANAHCNWVMRRHPDGGLVSVRAASEHELAHAKARQHLRAGVAQLEVNRYFTSRLKWPGGEMICSVDAPIEVVAAPEYDALAAQRDEGLAREAELRRTLEDQGAMIEAEQEMKATARKQRDKVTRRLAEAKALLERWGNMFSGGIAASKLEELRNENTAFLASPGCADGEKQP